jgi:5-formyltetrahydrofolate cyclo-ligase
MTLTEQKTIARQEAYARRKAAKALDLDGRAARHLARWLEPRRGQVLAGYMPIRTEIDPIGIMSDWTRDGKVGVPVIMGDAEPLTFRRWQMASKMIEGPFGAAIPERGEDLTPDILIVPLLAFDAEGARLGYGGGFYDRTLEQLRAVRPTIAVGFAFSAQRTRVLPVEPTDQPLDAIVTELGVMEFGAR